MTKNFPGPDSTTLRSDDDFKRADYELRRHQVQHERLAKSALPLWGTAVISAAIGAAASLGVTFLQSMTAIDMEQRKHESTLIVNAMTLSKTQDEAARWLRFLVDAGLVPSLDGTKLSEMAASPETLPARAMTASYSEPSSDACSKGADVGQIVIHTDRDNNVRLFLCAQRVENGEGVDPKGWSVLKATPNYHNLQQ